MTDNIYVNKNDYLKLKANVNRLRAQVGGLSKSNENLRRVNKTLEAENERLRRNAKRYQWVRDNHTVLTTSQYSDLYDQAVDEAMKDEKQN